MSTCCKDSLSVFSALSGSPSRYNCICLHAPAFCYIAMTSITLKLTAILPATQETRPLRGLPHVPLEVAQQAGVALFLLCLQPL